MLKVKIAYVFESAFGCLYITMFYPFSEIKTNLQLRLLSIIHFLVIPGDIVFCICQRVIRDIQKLRMLADFLNVFSCGFIAISDSHLNIVSGIYGFCVIS